MMREWQLLKCFGSNRIIIIYCFEFLLLVYVVSTVKMTSNNGIYAVKNRIAYSHFMFSHQITLFYRNGPRRIGGEMDRIMV